MRGKHIIIGVTGSIAAYKVAALVRLLVKEGAEVKVVMTELAKQFITPLTMATLSKHPVMVEFYNPENGDWHSHVDMGLWADLYLIAPATANTIGKMAHGIADNLLLTTYLSAKCPVMVAPAMDLDMYRHAATQRNLDILREYGNLIIEPAEGELASGLTGKGRMAEPEEIVCYIRHYFDVSRELTGKKVLVTAGPTYEKIDPVRFIGNYSTGKMGFALAEEFANRGAEVILVMAQAPDCDVVVSCAAVADFTPLERADTKMKRGSEQLVLELQPTQDIAAALGRLKKAGQVLVGFALETNDEIVHAIQKLHKKNLDLIVLNSLKDAHACFGYDTNKVTMIDRDEQEYHYELKTKQAVAGDIADRVVKMIC